MTEISYADACVPVREDIPASHRRAWSRLARPGAWWSGSERVAVAAEVRNASKCPLCAERKTAPSPNSVEGKHATLGALPDAAVEVIHRVTTDPGSLSKSWFDAVTSETLSDGQYVEIIGVVVTVVSIDSFCRGMGLPPNPLPAAEPGDPTRRRPEGAEHDGAWVPMLDPSRLAESEADLFGGSRTGNVIRALSLVPDEVRGLKDLSAAHYLAMDDMIDLDKGRSIDRRQVELIAGRVSALNECFY